MSASSEIILHPPDAHNPPIDLDIHEFMGTWHVTHSTLPLWKSRKDVTITYALKTSPTAGETVKFDDIVEYRSKSEPSASTRSRIVGVDTLIVEAGSNPTPVIATDSRGSGPNNMSKSQPSDSESRSPATDSADTGGSSTPPGPSRTVKPARTRYKWRGKGWLAVASSRWQLLGCSRDPSRGNAAAWAVTYFEKTLFTPAGLDIYSRTAQGLPEAVVREIIGKVKGLGGDVAALAEGFFEVERSGEGGLRAE